MSLKQLLRNKDFMYLLTGRILSVLADSLVFMTLLKWLELNSETSTSFTWFYLAYFLPAAFLALPIGTWVERKNFRKVMLWSDGIRGIILLIFLLSLPQIPIIWAYIYIIIESSIALFFFPANQSLLPYIVEKKLLPQANSLLQLGYIVVRTIGFMAATFFVSISFSISTILLIAVFFLFLSLPLIKRIKPIEKKVKIEESLIKGIKAGIIYVGGHKIIRNMFMLFGIAWLVASSIDLVIISYIEKVLNQGVENFSYVATAVFLGMIIGAFLASSLYEKFEQKWFIVLPLFIYSISILSMNYFEDLKMIIPFFFIGGISLSIFEVFFTTYLQDNIKEEQYARTFSFYNMILNFMPLPGILFFGYWMQISGINSVIWVISGLLFVTGIIGLFALPKLKTKQ